MSLPKCKGVNCPVDKNTCRRFTAERIDIRQVWLRFSDNKKGGCQEFLHDLNNGGRR